MAVKTITIDMEAYTLLAADKQQGESFSQVIKRRLRPRHTASALLENLAGLALGKDALDKIEDVVAARRESPISSAVFDLDA